MFSEMFLLNKLGNTKEFIRRIFYFKLNKNQFQFEKVDEITRSYVFHCSLNFPRLESIFSLLFVLLLFHCRYQQSSDVANNLSASSIAAWFLP